MGRGSTNLALNFLIAFSCMLLKLLFSLYLYSHNRDLQYILLGKYFLDALKVSKDKAYD